MTDQNQHAMADLEQLLVTVTVSVEGVTAEARGTGVALWPRRSSKAFYVLTTLHCLRGVRDQSGAYPVALEAGSAVKIGFLGVGEVEASSCTSVDGDSVLQDEAHDLALIVLSAAAWPDKIPKGKVNLLQSRRTSDSRRYGLVGFPAYTAPKRQTIRLKFAGGEDLQIFDTAIADASFQAEDGASQIQGISGAGVFDLESQRLIGIVATIRRGGTDNVVANRITVRRVNATLLNGILESRESLSRLSGGRGDRLSLLEGIDTEEVTVSGVALDVWRAITYLKNDLLDDWFRDPIGYKDLLNSLVASRLLQACHDEYIDERTARTYVPKPGFTTRPAHLEGFTTRVYYQALVNEVAPHLDPFLSSCVYSFRVRTKEGPKQPEQMFHYSIEQWKKFQFHTHTSLSEDQPYLLVTDISHFFEHIGPTRLGEQLSALANSILDAEVRGRVLRAIKLIVKLLDKSGVNRGGVGIPQNRDASSFLANAYLHSVDKKMENRFRGRYTRFMDDIRVVCRSKREARVALVELSLALESLGNLSLNDAKTHLFNAKTDKVKLTRYLPSNDTRLEQIDSLLRSGTRRGTQIAVTMTLKLLGKTLEDEPAQDPDRNRKLSFCVQRLSRFARQPYLAGLVKWANLVPMLISSIQEQPWMSQTITTLMISIPKKNFSDRHQADLIELVVSDEAAVYDWQVYHLFLFFARHRIKDPRLIKKAFEGLAGRSDVRSYGLVAGACIYLVSIDYEQYVDEVETALTSGRLTDRLSQRAAVISLRRRPTDEIDWRGLPSSLRKGHEELHGSEEAEFVVPLPVLPLSQVLRSLPGVVSGADV